MSEEVFVAAFNVDSERWQHFILQEEFTPQLPYVEGMCIGGIDLVFVFFLFPWLNRMFGCCVLLQV